ncbi:NAD(P)H-dependent oxidoreductase [Novosphingobium sp. G106]|uniref:NAD(P)H-dependent oxidoreductase n=1 Tax=Novosphingobium sp. G106 TaxID=2849500 RepID=UPI002111F9E8|nr:NAD(P)H-dependent oxidoreductase [Novosphingobium sp. G106]
MQQIGRRRIYGREIRSPCNGCQSCPLPNGLSTWKNDDHFVYALEQRRDYDAGTLPDDIMAELGNVLAADFVMFSFPVFWFSVPALLQGWIDRVFISGLFYDGR